MKGVRTLTTIAPIAAVMSALATLACCLPWGIGAALGALGLSVFLARFQLELTGSLLFCSELGSSRCCD